MGEGTDEDVERIAPLALRARAVRVARTARFRCARRGCDEHVRELVELAFRELGHWRITVPPFGSRPAAEWVRELKMRREGLGTDEVHQ